MLQEADDDIEVVYDGVSARLESGTVSSLGSCSSRLSMSGSCFFGSFSEESIVSDDDTLNR